MCKKMKDFIEKIKEKTKDFFDDDEPSIFDEYDEYGEDEVCTFEEYNGEDEESCVEVFDEDNDVIDVIDGKIYK